MKELKMIQDGNGFPIPGSLPNSDHIDVMVLAAGVAEEVIKPVDARYAVITADVDIWVQWIVGATAVVPGADLLRVAPELYHTQQHPTVKEVAGATFSIVSGVIVNVSIAWYS